MASFTVLWIANSAQSMNAIKDSWQLKRIVYPWHASPDGLVAVRFDEDRGIIIKDGFQEKTLPIKEEAIHISSLNKVLFDVYGNPRFFLLSTDEQRNFLLSCSADKDTRKHLYLRKMMVGEILNARFVDETGLVFFRAEPKNSKVDTWLSSIYKYDVSNNAVSICFDRDTHTGDALEHFESGGKLYEKNLLGCKNLTDNVQVVSVNGESIMSETPHNEYMLAVNPPEDDSRAISYGLYSLVSGKKIASDIPYQGDTRVQFRFYENNHMIVFWNEKKINIIDTRSPQDVRTIEVNNPVSTVDIDSSFSKLLICYNYLRFSDQVEIRDMKDLSRVKVALDHLDESNRTQVADTAYFVEQKPDDSVVTRRSDWNVCVWRTTATAIQAARSGVSSSD